MALEFELDAKRRRFISELNRFSGTDQSVRTFTNTNGLFGVQFKL